MKKMTYTSILAAAQILAMLPLDVTVREKGEEPYSRSLDGKLTGRILALLANLNKLAKAHAELDAEAKEASVPKEFQEKYSAYRDKLVSVVPEGFAQKLNAYDAAKAKNPEYSDAELEKEMAEIHEKQQKMLDTEIEKESAEYNKRYKRALEELGKQEVEVSIPLLSPQEFEAITEHTNGAVIRNNGVEVPRLLWLSDLQELLLE